MSKPNSQHYQVSVDEVHKLLNESLRVNMLMADENERIILASGHLLTYTGYSAEELTSHFTFSQLFKVKGSLRELYTTHFEQPGDAKDWPQGVMLGKNGEKTPYQFSILRLIQDGELVYLVTFKNYIERPQLSLLQKFADRFLQDVNLGVLLISMDFKLVDISDMACRILGFEREHILNKSLDEVFVTVPSEHRLVQRSILNGVVVRNYAVSWTNNNERYELLLDSNVLKDSQGGWWELTLSSKMSPICGH
ncbi:PAS domain-containing protein [Paenibacillus hexagrammi]|uniref:PAS domain-containing protein n=1 Tax=Paenibacillus hexagrammi TaxID=2908839 RepID=UPI0028835672|nr:PAS domain-containing protein [Paenibacillus sp. YPD9-1]